MSKKMTKKAMFEQIMAHTTDKAEREFLANEIQLLDNKSANRKPTAEQKANELLKDELYKVLLGGRFTVSEVWRSKSEWFSQYSPQKFSALFKQMEAEGRVRREEVKRVAYFTAIVVEGDTEAEVEVEGD